MIVRLANTTTFLCVMSVTLIGGCGKAEYEARMKKKASQLASQVPVADEDQEAEEDTDNVEFDRGAPAERSRRPGSATLGAVYRTESKGNLRQIGQAILNYVSQHGELPPRYLTTADGQPGLSWRVALLPFLDEDGLFRRFNRREPWDSDQNRRLIATIPRIYRLPQSNADDGRTNYLGIAGPNSVFVDDNGLRMTNVRDGTSKTVFVVEVDDDLAVEWTKPDDLEWQPSNPSAGLGGLYNAPVFIAGFLDATVREIPSGIDNEQLTGLFTTSGGERVMLDF